MGWTQEVSGFAAACKKGAPAGAIPSDRILITVCRFPDMAQDKSRQKRRIVSRVVSQYFNWLKAGSSLFAIVLALSVQHSLAEDSTGNLPVENAADETTLVYDQEYFAGHPNAITALDIIRRIPTGSQILDTRRSDRRGFAANEDRILIDGRRITGKQNDSISALERIAIDQIERIEIIRGESPDIRVSSGEAVLNVVLIKSDDAGSGSWQAMAEAVEGIDIGLNGKLAYGARAGNLAYVLSANRLDQVRTFKVQEEDFNAADSFISQLNETEKITFLQETLSAGITYSMDNGDIIRANASYEDTSYPRNATGVFFEPGEMDSLTAVGNTSRHYEDGHPVWEFSGDYETEIGESMRLKVLGLYTQKDQNLDLGEDFLIEGDTSEDDYQFFLNQYSTETIGRASLTWTPNPRYELEFGTEVAVNELDSQSRYLDRQDGILIEVPLPGSNLSIEEFRNESFLDITFKPNDKLSVDAALVAEYSEIELSEPDAVTKRDFFFLKPALDLRYNLTANDQFQAQIKRQVDQLEFADFAASTSIDNQAYAGNSELEQRKRWIYEVGFERRLKDDGGRFMVRLRHHRFSDYIGLVPVDDGSGNLVSAVGNIGDGTLWQLLLEGSFRMTRFGLPDMVIDSTVRFNKTEVTDAFTGEKHNFPRWADQMLRVEVRHDLNDLGFSYGGRMSYSRGRELHDINDRFETKPELFFGLFAEYQVFDGITFRMDVNDVTNYDRGWNRFKFEDGTASGIVTSRNLRELREGVVYNFALSGTF